jgi:glutathione S-transferase
LTIGYQNGVWHETGEDAMARLRLVIGNKRYSSWSLRPWLALKAAGLDFAEEVIPLYRVDSGPALARQGAAGKVPVLHDGDLTVWDSLAICEHVAELAPAAGLWPQDRAARAVARAAVAEMHSGFADLRQNCFMDAVERHDSPARRAAAAADMVRIDALWRQCRARFGAAGPYLFGGFTIADCFYTPVAVRWRGWGLDLSADGAAYAEALLARPHYREWLAAARAEPWVMGHLQA